MAEPTITAIVPYYEPIRPGHFREALSSIYWQTLMPCELIIVDDGSPDGGPAKTMEGVERRCPTRVLRKENGGQGSARNYGAARAEGQFLAFLDQDDVWLPRHLERLIRPLLRREGLGWSYSNLDRIDFDRWKVAEQFLDFLPGKHPKRHVVDMILGDMYVLPGASVIRKAAFAAVGGFDERLRGYEDDDLFLRIFRAGWSSVYLRRSTALWRIHNTSTSYSEHMDRSRRIFQQKLLDAFPDDPGTGSWYVRDYIAPRFLSDAKARYEQAKARGVETAMQAAADDMRRFAALFDAGPDALKALDPPRPETRRPAWRPWRRGA